MGGEGAGLLSGSLVSMGLGVIDVFTLSPQELMWTGYDHIYGTAWIG